MAGAPQPIQGIDQRLSRAAEVELQLLPRLPRVEAPKAGRVRNHRGRDRKGKVKTLRRGRGGANQQPRNADQKHRPAGQLEQQADELLMTQVVPSQEVALTASPAV